MDTVYLASVSGGKDSTAMCLHLRELGIEYRAIHFDTGWEHAETVRYVREVLPRHIGPIEIVSREPKLGEREEAWAQELEAMLGFRSPFVRYVLQRGMFPSRARRYCTQELKVFCVRNVVKAVHAADQLPVNVVGIRAAESYARSKLPEREISTSLDCMVWRPLLRWSERQVIDIHKRHNVPPNPLYLRGLLRVGCWPCVQANKKEIRALDAGRIQVIERLEELCGLLAQERGAPNANAPGMFQRMTRDPVTGERPCIPIREHVAWSRTLHGSDLEDQQLGFQSFNDGCLRWGLCDLPAEDA